MTASTIPINSASHLDFTASLLWRLSLGGFSALGFWEVWANWPTQLVAGYPLEPFQLIKELFLVQFGAHVPDVWAKGLHYVTGVIFYPIGFWILIRLGIVSRFIDGWVWGIITYFLALGVFAPLAGLPFLLIGDNATLSIMSLIGHAVYGYVLSAVFHPLQACAEIRRA